MLNSTRQQNVKLSPFMFSQKHLVKLKSIFLFVSVDCSNKPVSQPPCFAQSRAK